MSSTLQQAPESGLLILVCILHFQYLCRPSDLLPATKYPAAKIIGTDLSPIQPSLCDLALLSSNSSFRPSNRNFSVKPNCRFEIDDAEDDWTYTNSFDYVHGRLLLSCFNNDFPAVISKAFAALSPEGWFELQDMLLPICFDISWDGTVLRNSLR